MPGIEYTAVDDAHFLAAGLERDQLWGAYLTEDEGERIRVLPIRRELRYLIPFQPPERTVEWLKASADAAAGTPRGARRRRREVRPVARNACRCAGRSAGSSGFAAALEAERDIELVPPGEALAATSRAGRRLPAERLVSRDAGVVAAAGGTAPLPRRGARARARARRGGARPAARRALARFPDALPGVESASQAHAARLETAACGAARTWAPWREAQNHLWRSQCNCPYWHGIFGGLYLPHLREAVYRELIAVERYLCTAPPHVERGDFDLDGFEDALLETREWAAWVSARGGALWALDDRRRARSWGDTLARRDEPYHDALAHGPVGGGEGASIHEAIRATEAGLDALARETDPGPRDSFLERWTDASRPPRPDAGPTHDWSGARFRIPGRAGARDRVARA